MNSHRAFILAAATLSAALWAYACGDGATEPPPPDPPRPTTVTVSPAAAELTALGATVQLSAEVRDQNGQVMAAATVAWTTDNAPVATVDASGVVTSAGNGSATITATAGAASGSATVSVAQRASAVTVSPAADTLVAGDTLRLGAVAADANGHPVAGAEFSWASSDTSVAVVDDAGLVTGVGAGQAEITASTAGVTGRADLTIVAPAPTTVTVAPDTVTLTALGQTAQLYAEVRDQIGRVMQGIRLSWSSADTTVAVVDSAGLVTAAGVGETTIAAMSGDASGEAVVTVMQSVGSVVVSPAADTIAPSDTLRLEAEAFDANGHRVDGAQFDWSSSAVSVARVDGSGLVAAVAEGTTTITATAGDARGTAEITVENPDRAVLVALYNATDGPNWVNSGNWLTDVPLQNWYGVSTDATGRVVRVDLAGRWDSEARVYVPHGLSGPIPPEISSLANLQWLNLSHNQLTGPIPSELGNLANLTRLDIRYNQLTGAVLPKLSSLANLEYLGLSGNQLTGSIPTELGSLSNLTGLSLGSNALTGPIPSELGSLANLEYLSLDANELTGPIPPEFGNLASLDLLALAANQLTGPIPPELGNLTNLQDLRLFRTALSGAIPPELGNLAELRELHLSSTALTGPIPPEFGNLVNLRFLSLRGNDHTGPIPPELGNLTALEELRLYDTNLSGPIPPELGNLAALEELHLYHTNVSGPLPPELGKLANARFLSLASNDLSGPVPAELGGLANVEVLALANNEGLAGALPQSLTELHRLQELAAGGTGLCAPTDLAFQTWLDRVFKHRIAPCVAGNPPAAYLIQAVQSPAFPVPLVAGEKALLRVFPTARQATSVGIPAVRARFYLNGRETHIVDIAGKAVPIPTEMDESSLLKSANAEIPAEIIRPGLELVVEVDPQGTLDDGLGVARRIPETGRLALDIRDMPVFDLTLIPFVWSETQDSSIVDLVQAMAADPANHEMFADTRALLPIGDFAVTAHEPVVSSSNSAFSLLSQTTAIRAMEGSTGHYKGMMSPPVTGAGGVALRPGRSSFSQPNSGTVAHELGHNMSLLHAPCGGPGALDPSFPYSDGSIGAWGYDSRHGGKLVLPDAPDVMGYCFEGRWISDYHFTNALRFRLSDADSVGLPDRAPEQRSLLLWGGVDADGNPFLEPAFVVDSRPELPLSGATYRIAGSNEGGSELFSLSFDMPEVADGDGSSSFAFVLPVRPGWEGNLAGITLTGPEGSTTLNRDTNLPMAILRNPRTGQIRGILRDPLPAMHAAADGGATRATGIEVLFSRGIPGPEAWRR